MSEKKKISPNTSLEEKILAFLKKSATTAYNYKQIAAAIGKKGKREEMTDCLEKMLENNDIIETKKGKYLLNTRKHASAMGQKIYITGRVDMKQTGKAYILCDEPREDIYIAPYNTNRALNGDKVKVLMMPRRKGRKPEGQIVEIIERAKDSFVGVIQISKYYSYLIPDNNSVPVDIYIPNNKTLDAKNGDKVLAKITEWPENSKNPFGEVVHVLGSPGSNQVEMLSIIAEFGFPLAFPEKVEKDALQIHKLFTEEEIKRRRDFRNIFTITIDPEDAKDFDDALSLRVINNETFEVGIHIADVSFFVKEGSVVDAEAYNRGTSVYLADRVVPMLPEALSNDLCSLKPNENKLCFSAVFAMDINGNISDEWFGRTVICSDRRFNYDEVQKIIEDRGGEYAEEILILNGIAVKLREKRFERGAIAFDSEEVRFKYNEKGYPVEVIIKQQKDSNKLVEEFMLLANRKVAELCGKPKDKSRPKTFVYRIHDKPVPEKLEAFRQLIHKLGYQINNKSGIALARSMNELFESIKGKGEENMINSVAIRTMAKALYSTENIGHYGLAFGHYTHFTSPIRRYPDLMVHRLLERYEIKKKESVNRQEYEKMCEHCSDMERNAVEAERASVKYMQAHYLADKIGRVFDGRISGISKWGIYVEIIENKCEGMVSVRDMDDDVYIIDEENYTAKGQYSGVKYALGDNVRIKVKKINLGKKQIDFAFIK